MNETEKSRSQIIDSFDENDFLTRIEDNWWHFDTNLRASFSATPCRRTDDAACGQTQTVNVEEPRQESVSSNNIDEVDESEAAGDGWRLLSDAEDYAAVDAASGWREAILNGGQSKLSALYNLLRATPDRVTLNTQHDIWLLGRQYTFINRTRQQQQVRLLFILSVQ